MFFRITCIRDQSSSMKSSFWKWIHGSHITFDVAVSYKENRRTIWKAINPVVFAMKIQLKKETWNARALFFFQEVTKISLLFLVFLLALSRFLVAMTQGNSTEVTEFFFLGFGAPHKFHYVLFVIFLVIYVTSMVGNIGMILLIKTDPRLQTPMYFFLQHLAFVDICYTSAITPKMLQNFIAENISISFRGCVVQLLVYATFATSDGYLLAAMAVDRYVAICNPLHYPTVMSRRVCIHLVAGSYVIGSTCAHRFHIFTVVLQIQYPQSLFLWCSTNSRPLMLQHWYQCHATCCLRRI